MPLIVFTIALTLANLIPAQSHAAEKMVGHRITLSRSDFGRHVITYFLFGAREIPWPTQSDLPVLAPEEFFAELAEPELAFTSITTSSYRVFPNHRFPDYGHYAISSRFAAANSLKESDLHYRYKLKSQSILQNVLRLLQFQKQMVESKGLASIGSRNAQNLNRAIEALIIQLVESADRLLHQQSLDEKVKFNFMISLRDFLGSRPPTEIHNFTEQTKRILRAQFAQIRHTIAIKTGATDDGWPNCWIYLDTEDSAQDEK